MADKKPAELKEEDLGKAQGAGSFKLPMEMSKAKKTALRLKRRLAGELEFR